MSVKRNKRERGFTLIELISVIIILGILAAVITPRYMNMTEQARTSANNGALAEGNARFNMAYATALMRDAGNPPANLAALTGGATPTMNATMDLGDYVVHFSGTGGAGQTVTLDLWNNPPTGTTTRVTDGNAVPSGTRIATREINWPAQ